MRAISTIEADLYLAERAQRRNPCAENQEKVAELAAELKAALGESVDTPEVTTPKAEEKPSKKEPQPKAPKGTQKEEVAKKK